MNQMQGFDYMRLEFNEQGTVAHPDAVKSFVAMAADPETTDVLLISHGWRNSAGEAEELYGRFLESLRAHFDGGAFADKLQGRRFLIGGIVWPSKAFLEGNEPEVTGSTASVGGAPGWQDEVLSQLEDLRDHDAEGDQKDALSRAMNLVPELEASAEARDQFAAEVLSILAGAKTDPNEGVDLFRSQSGSEVMDRLGSQVVTPVRAADDMDGGTAGVATVVVAGEDGEVAGIGDWFRPIGNRVKQFLNFTTWYLMLDRSGKVGESGVATLVRELRQAKADLRIHLAGHSLGGRLMVSCARAVTQAPAVQVQSLTLLQAAFSHYGLAPSGDGRPDGYFRDVLVRRAVDGPILATFSDLDTVVGYAYALAERIVRNDTRAIGDKTDRYGGIGRNGAQATPECVEVPLGGPGSAYTFDRGGLYCLNGCGLIQGHGDIARPEITWAFASAVL